MNARNLSLAFTILFSSILLSCQQEKPAQVQPNIVIIFSDELAPEYLGCYGGSFSTPNIDGLAEEGMRFTNAYTAASMCTPSRFALLTGLYPGHCKHPKFLSDFPEDIPYSAEWNVYIDSDAETIARQLSKNGYRTGMAGKWHVGRLPEGIAFPELEWEDDPASPEVQEKLRRFQEISVDRVKKDAGFTHAASVLWGNYDGLPLKELRHHNFPWITKGAVDFIEESAACEQPFFLYVATTAVHGPLHSEMFDHDLRYTPEGYVKDVMNYIPPDELIKNKLGDLSTSAERHKFSGMACLDHHVGIILSKLEDLELDQNTMIVFLADHNIEPGKSTCYEKGNLIPMIIKWPGKVEGGSVSNALIQSVDLFPTLLSIAGMDIRDDLITDGKSIVPILEGEKDEIREFVYLEAGYTRAITNGKYKYMAYRPTQDMIRRMEEGEVEMAVNHLDSPNQATAQIALENYPGYFDQDQLYNLENDPYEQNSLANDPSYKEQLLEMQSELLNYLNSFEHPFPLDEIPFMYTDQYKTLAEKAVERGTDWVIWLKRDHGRIIWPPEN